MLCVVTFIMKGKSCLSDKKRILKEYKFYHEDLEKLDIWKNIVFYLSKDDNYLALNSDKIISKDLNPFVRTLLVFINSFAGNGNARTVWRDSKKLLSYAGYQFHEIITLD